MSNLTLSKTAQALVDDAREAGYAVEVREWSKGVDVLISQNNSALLGKADAGVYFEVQNTAPNNSRLGFPTTYRRGFRFSYANARNFRGEYVTPKSIREVRFALGLAI